MLTFPTGERVLGRILRADGVPLDRGEALGRAPHVSVMATAPTTQMEPTLFQTGIKSIDLFCPLRAGGLHQIGAGPGVGKEVVLGEIVHNVSRYERGCAVWVAPRQQHADGHHMAQSFRESGVLSSISMIIAPAGQERQALQSGLALARSFALEGRPVLLGIESDALTPSAAALLSQDDSVTRFIVTHGSELTPQPSSLIADATITFSMALAKQNIWPAIDGASSSSHLLAEGSVTEEHARVAQEARELITQDSASPRARRLLRFGSQPFAIAEPFTARPGVSVSLADTIKGYAAVLSGAYNDVPEEWFAFQGSLPPHP